MDQMILLNVTGNREVDRVLQATVGIFETTFPGRLKAFYLYGSQADSSAVSISDIDLLIVFGDGFRGDEEQRAGDLRHYCQLLTEMRLEPSVCNIEQLMHDAVRAVIIKQGSLLIYGSDIRERILLPPTEVYTQQVTRNLHRFLLGVRKTGTATFPLAYPDPNDEFYGYAQEEILEWHPHFMHGGGTQTLVVSIGWAATALLALQSRRTAFSRREAFRLYQECIGGEWAGFLREVYDTCKTQWGYHVPEAASDRARLRELCRRALAFENHVLSIYRGYLLEELRAEDVRRQRFAAQRLAEIIYSDGEVMEALASAQQSGDPELREIAREIMRKVTVGDGGADAGDGGGERRGDTHG